MEAGPSSEDSIRYQRALDALDRVTENVKKMTGYVSSSDSDDIEMEEMASTSR